MRIFNGTNSLLTLPLSSRQKLEILPKSVSTEFMGNKEFLSLVVASLKSSEVAIVVSGPYELSVCSNIPAAVDYVVQTLDEAIIRFGLKKSEPKHEECTCEKCKAEKKAEEKPVVEEDVIPDATEEPVEEPKTENIMPEEVPTENVEEKVKPAKKSKKKKKAEE